MVQCCQTCAVFIVGQKVIIHDCLKMNNEDIRSQESREGSNEGVKNAGKRSKKHYYYLFEPLLPRPRPRPRRLLDLNPEATWLTAAEAERVDVRCCASALARSALVILGVFNAASSTGGTSRRSRLYNGAALSDEELEAGGGSSSSLSKSLRDGK